MAFEQVALPVPKFRDVFLSGTVDHESCKAVNEKIIDIRTHDEYLKKLYKVHNINYTPEPIKLFIDSYGGYVNFGSGTVSIVEQRDSTPVHTIVTGCAMSMGYIISLVGAKRFAHKHSTFMFHGIASMEWGKIPSMEIGVKESKRLQDKLLELCVKYTKIDEATYNSYINTQTDWYISAEEALVLGIIDEIL